jgi:hypothetical protein
MRPIGLVVVLTLSLVVAPVDAGAQQMPRMPRIGVLAAGTADEAPNISFFERLREMGYVEGQKRFRRVHEVERRIRTSLRGRAN